MSAEEALTARLADLESDSFQLKLRNYYLERRVSKESTLPSCQVVGYQAPELVIIEHYKERGHKLK